MKEHLTPSPYFSYMLRIWPECQQAEETHWRFALVDPKTGTQHGFATLDNLMTFLSSLTDKSTSISKQAP